MQSLRFAPDKPHDRPQRLNGNRTDLFQLCASHAYVTAPDDWRKILDGLNLHVEKSMTSHSNIFRHQIRKPHLDQGSWLGDPLVWLSVASTSTRLQIGEVCLISRLHEFWTP
jgi:hypothetical protein